MGVLRAEQVQLAGCDPAQQPTSQAPEQGALDGGPSGPLPNVTSNLWLQQSQAQMEEVVSIMRVNVDKVLDRDIRLTEMDSKADALETDASVFKTSAGWLKRKYWWKNCKMMIMLGVICAIVMAIVRVCSDVGDILVENICRFDSDIFMTLKSKDWCTSLRAHWADTIIEVVGSGTVAETKPKKVMIVWEAQASTYQKPY
nr:vesicle-associated membrane protein 1 isoform X2 [Pelodiscus sinensis]|eukprot:XP_025040985.1 vesicle-associated membrane protein 1 isoform X2 [Pelodiscus sinensis]